MRGRKGVPQRQVTVVCRGLPTEISLLASIMSPLRGDLNWPRTGLLRLSPEEVQM